MANLIAWLLYIIGACTVVAQGVDREGPVKDVVLLVGLALLWPLGALVVIAARVMEPGR